MSVLDGLIDSRIEEAFGGTFDPSLHPRGFHGQWASVAHAVERALKSSSFDSAAHGEMTKARAALHGDKHLSGPTVAKVKSHLTRAVKHLDEPHDRTDRTGSALRARSHIVNARETLDRVHRSTPTPDMHGAIRNLMAGHRLAASDEQGIGALLEAFTSGGPFNPGAHPRGGHGYFIATGSQGQGVKRVQGAVGAKQDGQFGSQTRAAIERYQRQHGLKVDGVIGRQTAAALLGSKGKLTPGAMTAKQARALGVSLGLGGRTTSTRRARAASARQRTTRTSRRTKAAQPTRMSGGLLVG